MGWYFRRSVKMGPLRFNFSKSGIGASIGVKGARLSVGPKGTFVSLGMGGIYYRQKIVSAQLRNSEERFEHHIADDANLEQLESVGIEELKDSKFDDLLSEINEKFVKPELSKIFVIVLVLGFLVLTTVLSFTTSLFIILSCTLGLIPLSKIDNKRKLLELNYSLDDGADRQYKNLFGALKNVHSSNKVWRIMAQGDTNDWKRNAGAGSLVKRVPANLICMPPKFMDINIEVFQLVCNGYSLCFLPDVVLIYEGKRVGAISYDNLIIEIGTTSFIESEVVPSDSKRISTTWKYVNKNGTPDRRFSNNKQLPILLYGELYLKSSSGLNLLFHTSNDSVPHGFMQAISSMGNYIKSIKV